MIITNISPHLPTELEQTAERTAALSPAFQVRQERGVTAINSSSSFSCSPFCIYNILAMPGIQPPPSLPVHSQSHAHWSIQLDVLSPPPLSPSETGHGGRLTIHQLGRCLFRQLLNMQSHVARDTTQTKRPVIGLSWRMVERQWMGPIINSFCWPREHATGPQPYWSYWDSNPCLLIQSQWHYPPAAWVLYFFQSSDQFSHSLK